MKKRILCLLLTTILLAGLVSFPGLPTTEAAAGEWYSELGIQLTLKIQSPFPQLPELYFGVGMRGCNLDDIIWQQTSSYLHSYDDNTATFQYLCGLDTIVSRSFLNQYYTNRLDTYQYMQSTPLDYFVYIGPFLSTAEAVYHDFNLEHYEYFNNVYVGDVVASYDGTQLPITVDENTYKVLRIGYGGGAPDTDVSRQLTVPHGWVPQNFGSAVYTVRWSNTGQTYIGSAGYIEGQEIPWKIATRKGYDFIGWKEENGALLLEDDFPIIATKDMVFFAVWELNGDPIPPTNPGYPSYEDPIVIVGDIIVPSITSPETAYIDLSSETITLPPGFKVGAYSLDGMKWRVGALPTGAKFSKLLDRGMALKVAGGYNKKTRQTTGKVIEFPRINQRQRAYSKLKPYYDEDTWELLTKDGNVPETMQNLELAKTTDKKTPDGKWNDADSFAITKSGSEKATYLVRVAPTAEIIVEYDPIGERLVDNSIYTPASKPYKVTPMSFSKAPNYEVKDGKIRLKKGDRYVIADNEPEDVTSSFALDVSELPKGTKIIIWKAETGKRPRSEKQTIVLKG